jgi:hypothetical protein
MCESLEEATKRIYDTPEKVKTYECNRNSM